MKLIDKGPLKYSMVEGSSWLNPNVVKSNTLCQSRVDVAFKCFKKPYLCVNY